MPKEAINYLKTLPEFDAKIFKEIIGLDVSEPNLPDTEVEVTVNDRTYGDMTDDRENMLKEIKCKICNGTGETIEPITDTLGETDMRETLCECQKPTATQRWKLKS